MIPVRRTTKSPTSPACDTKSVVKAKKAMLRHERAELKNAKSNVMLANEQLKNLATHVEMLTDVCDLKVGRVSKKAEAAV